MRRFSVRFTDGALKDLRKMDRQDAALITGWVRKHLEGCQDPRAHGKPLVGNHSGQWRYRVGDYRILAEINDEVLLILVLTAGHRREVY